MDVVARETRFVTGRSVEHGGAGDSSVLTAWGVFQGMRAAAEHVLGHARRWPGRRVGIAGLGKVGKHLTGHLLDDGADGGRHRRQRAGAGLGPHHPPAGRPRRRHQPR